MPATALTLNSKLVQGPDQVSGALDGDVVMLSLATDSYHLMNSVGSYIWLQIETPTSFDEVVERLLLEFEIDRETCEREARAFTERLLKAGLARIVEDAEPSPGPSQ